MREARTDGVSANNKRLDVVLMIAAITVIILSLVGIAAMLGWIPKAYSFSADARGHAALVTLS